MKNLLKIGLLLTLVLQGIAFAQAEVDKYTFSTLEQVSQFRTYNMKGTEVLDNRTVFVDVGPSQSYLLVLNRNLPGLALADNVEISTSNDMIRAGYDSVTAHDQGSVSAMIEKIYSIPDRDAHSMVRDRLIGSSD